MRPLSPRVVGGCVALAAVLVSAGCAPSPHDCAVRGDLETLGRILKEHPEAAAQTDRKLKTPLHMAAGVDNVAAMELLAAAGAPLEARDITGMTPLHVAAMYGRDRAAAWLLDHGASAASEDSFGDTPLHTAAVFGRGNTVKLLAGRGAPLDARNAEGLTPKELAVRNRQDRVAALLGRLGG